MTAREFASSPDHDPLVTLMNRVMESPPKTVERPDAVEELYRLVEDRMREVVSRLMRKERSRQPAHPWSTHSAGSMPSCP
jgi:hypothetical protein